VLGARRSVYNLPRWSPTRSAAQFNDVFRPRLSTQTINRYTFAVKNEGKTMAELQIIRIPILPLGLINAHLVLSASGCALVDAGLPGSAPKIEKVLIKHGLTFKDIKLIVVTHAHVDHAGSAYDLREVSGAPVVAHADDAKHFSRDTPMTFCPTGWFGRLFLKTRLM
jgi:hydroxyacylglutathione hydrolase